MMFERESAIEGYTEKGWMRVKFKWGTLSSSSSSSFGSASTPGQIQTRLGPRVYSFTTPVYCAPDQMLAVVVLSQHRVSSSKTVRRRALCGARCMGHVIRTWSAVSYMAPHSQFGEGARPHLCANKRLTLTQLSCSGQAQFKYCPALLLGIKTRSLDLFSQSKLQVRFIIRPLRSADAKSSKVV